jgi:ABC-type multidrug transport system fused ATPase/permease subunit
MNIQIRIIYLALLISIVSFQSCTVQKRLHFAGQAVRWNHSNKQNNSSDDFVVKSKNDTINAQTEDQIISTIDNIKSKQAIIQQNSAQKIENKINKFIEKSHFDKKIESLNTLKKKVSETKILKKNRFFKSEKKQAKPDNDMWGFFGSILVSALVAMAIIIVVALLVVWILSMLPLATAKIVGAILLAILLLFLILY